MEKLSIRKVVQKTLQTNAGKVCIFHLPKLEKVGGGRISRLPFSIKVLLESALRHLDGYQITQRDIEILSQWSGQSQGKKNVVFKPGRVVLQDFTGVPCLVDLAAMRHALSEIGGDYRKINPQVPCDLIIDHSVQVDAFGSRKAFDINLSKEFQRNRERYEFLKWGENAFKNFRVVPPARGIIHQVNLEYLAKGVLVKKEKNVHIAYPDSLIGTDSHTTMINGIGVVGWGVGGIEAEAVMLGEPLYMLMPEVIGLELTGSLEKGATATDLVLTVTQLLRKHHVVGRFVEFFGEGVRRLSLAERATVSNMSPEYGATMGIFPVDDETLNYYRMTGRKPQEVDLIERYMKEQGMFTRRDSVVPDYTQILRLDMSTVVPCLCGPKRPDARVKLNAVKVSFHKTLRTSVEKGGFGLCQEEMDRSVELSSDGKTVFKNGAVVIAAITSCTNTSNPSVLIGAGLLAQKAVKLGLKTKNFVKTSFAPGSRVVTKYLQDAGLLGPLEKLGFHVVGYGCTTCIGNSGPLPSKIEKAVGDNHLIVVSVLSGNRNFEGRIHPLTKANYLCSPLLVVAYALTGTVDIDFAKEPIGQTRKGKAVFLRDIWPKEEEINNIVSKVVTPKVFREQYRNIFKGLGEWESIKSKKTELYPWDKNSTYVQEPPFLKGLKMKPSALNDIRGARVLVMLGDGITTDHISPAGSIPVESPAGQYLRQLGISPGNFNSYGSRRGNDRVMTRGTFANIRLRNQLVPGREGSCTVYFPKGQVMSIYDAAKLYQKERIPLLVIAGQEYGTGSSRDWAAKGTALLGVRVVLARSFERIHRSNLVGMGVLPLQFKAGESKESLGLKGTEIFNFHGLEGDMSPHQVIRVVATAPDATRKEFSAVLRLDTPIEISYYRNGGILQTVFRKFAGIH